MTPDKLPLDLIKNIWADAERYAEEKVKAVNEEHFNVYNAHIAGATAWAGWKVKHDELQAQAQRMADALEEIAKEANNSPEDTWGEIAVRMKRIAIIQLQQLKDGKGKEVVCSCSLQQLAAHGECYKCPGQHTRHEITNPTK